jgi:dienelactone hydrolase
MQSYPLTFASVLALWVISAAPGTRPASAPSYPDKTNLLLLRDADGRERGISTAADWAKRRQHILVNMQLVMGSLPDQSCRVPLDIRVTERVQMKAYERQKLSFATEKGDRVPAYLFLRGKRVAHRPPAPAILCLHQTTSIGKAEPAGLGGSANLQYALELAERGFITLAPDYPSFGDYVYDFKDSSYQSGSMKAIWNNMRAIDFLQSLPDVDPSRIGCIGHSLGGHNAMFTAVFDTRIKALVSSCGFTSFAKYYDGNLKGWTSDRYMPRIERVYGSRPDNMPFDFAEVVAAFAPRAFLASAPLHDDNFEVTGVKDVFRAAKPVYELLGAGDKLAAHYPDCAHDFPPAARKLAYDWLERRLGEIR